MTDYGSLITSLRSWASDSGATSGIMEDAADAIEDLRTYVIAFGAPHAARYAQEFGLADGELHPRHYDILKRCGARMVDFKRAEIATDLSSARSAEDTTP